MSKYSKSLNVALLMGGRSAEREISLQSGKAVHVALEALGHQVYKADGIEGLKQINKQDIDLVFNVLHGADGEDGQLAAWLNLEGYQSTCVDFAAANLSWHKDQAKILVAKEGVLTPGSQLLKNNCDFNPDCTSISKSGPWIVKPATEGSSVGLFKVDNPSKLVDAVNSAFDVADQVLVEDYIDGTECTVGVVGDVVLPVVGIVPASGLYDYHAKYQSNDTQYHCPAKFESQWQLALQQDAKKACQALGMNGWCRVDFIVDDQGGRWFLEINTTPGMTNNSLLPKAAAAYGWDFNGLVAQILATAKTGSERACHE